MCIRYSARDDASFRFGFLNHLILGILLHDAVKLYLFAASSNCRTRMFVAGIVDILEILGGRAANMPASVGYLVGVALLEGKRNFCTLQLLDMSRYLDNGLSKA